MSGSIGASLGNPAPLGLAAFGTTTFYLMTVDMGWSSPAFEDLVAANAFWYGGLAQLLVGIAELLKGSSFSFLVFCSYGAFWMGFSSLYYATQDATSGIGAEPAPVGKTLYYLQWTVLTGFFAVVATRKNRGLLLLLGLLTLTFALLTLSTGIAILNSDAGRYLKRAAGYVGFATALQAYYMCFAEIVNEEWGRHVLPGLKPLVNAAATGINDCVARADAVALQRDYMSYDGKTNTLMLTFRGLQIASSDDVRTVREAIESKILRERGAGGGGGAADEEGKAAARPKINVIVDYRGAAIAAGVEQEYIEATAALQKQYYLSTTRFGISSFGTNASVPADYAISNNKQLG